MRVQGAGGTSMRPEVPAALASFLIQGLGFRVQGSGFRVQGAGFRVQDSGFLPESPEVDPPEEPAVLRVEPHQSFCRFPHSS